MARRRVDPVLRTVAAFAGLGLVVLVLVGAAGVVVLRRVATAQAMADARDLTALSARIVERRVENGVLQIDPLAETRLASVVGEAVMHYPVVGVRIWTPDGKVVYADVDETHLIGHRFPDAVPGLTGLADGLVITRSFDPSAPQNAGLEPAGLLDSFTTIHTPKKEPLLFETLQQSSSVARGRRHLLTSFAPVLLVALVAFGLLLIPLAWILAVRLQRASRDRAELLQRAVDVSDRERRRIAADLHDGPVQELAGLAMRLSAQAERERDPAGSAALRDTAGAVRSSVRTLRSAIVGVYPPNLEAEGLGQAISDLTARLPRTGAEVSLEVADPAGYGAEVDQLLYRACQEGLRNVEAHAAARHVWVRVHRDGGRAVLEIRDDGRGLEGSAAAQAREDGHMGLGLLREVLRDAGGELTVVPATDGGTLLHAEVPA